MAPWSSPLGMGRKQISWQRDIIVGSRPAGLDEIRIRTLRPGGSSSVLSRAFWASVRILSASSRMNTFYRDSNAFNAA